MLCCVLWIVTCYSISHLLIYLYFIMYIVLPSHLFYRILYPPSSTLLPLMFVISCVCQLINKEGMMMMMMMMMTFIHHSVSHAWSVCTDGSKCSWIVWCRPAIWSGYRSVIIARLLFASSAAGEGLRRRLTSSELQPSYIEEFAVVSVLLT